MQQMGWEKGKGLGANSQGEKDPIKVKMNIESRGLGCKRADMDKWIAHQDDFNSLLANLNSEAGEEKSGPPPAVQSLEAKSKSSKSRVHYMKFTKGKDLSRHSEKDLACVLGPSRSENCTPTVVSAPNSSLASPANSDDGVEGDNTDPFLSDAQHVTSTLSLQEYFASKMAAKKSGSSSNLLVDMVNKTPSPAADSDTAEASGTAKPTFFIGETGEHDEDVVDDVITGSDVIKTKKRRKKAIEHEEEEEEETEADKAERRERRRLKRRLRKEKERRAEEREAARHRSGGKTKPKPADDTMKFVSESSGAEDENEQQLLTENTKRKRKHGDTTNTEEITPETAEMNSKDGSRAKRKIRKSKSDSNLLAESDHHLLAVAGGADAEPKSSKKKSKKGRSKEL